MVAQTRKRGVHAITMSKQFRCSELEAMGPDQRKHVGRLKNDITSAAALLKLLGYDGPPELFNMYSCLLLSKICEQWDAEWVEPRIDRLIKLREKMLAQDGMQPLPMRLLQACWDGDD